MRKLHNLISETLVFEIRWAGPGRAGLGAAEPQRPSVELLHETFISGRVVWSS